MRHRKFGKLDWNVSVLGFGAMRLPVLADRSVDEPESIRMLRYAIDQGVNYIDTAYVYHGGESERVVGRALADGYRAKVRIATKSPLWRIQEADDFDRILAEQLQRLGTDHIDFYMMHGIGAEGWNQIRELGLMTRAEAARDDGRIGHIGFSFHDKYEALKAIIDGYEGWEFCQIQYNYMDTENQAGHRGLCYAASKGIPIVVMEPLLGGRLANPPASVRRLIEDFPTERTPAAWALRWIWDHAEVTTVLSGMSTMAQLEENLQSAGEAAAGVMGTDEKSLIARVRRCFEERTVVPCTKCDYCLPCPEGVEISRVFELYNGATIYDDVGGSQFAYRIFVPEEGRADRCIACGECEAKCPQEIEIGALMPKVHEVLGV
jgi:uncharacterized protein